MRRFMTISMAAVLAVVAAPTIASADPSTAEQPSGLEAIELDCGVRGAGDRVMAHCRWTEPGSPRAAAVKLFRLDPAVDRHRQTVYRSAVLSVTWFTDSHVMPGHRYTYGLVVYDEHGRRVGQSRPATVRIPPVHEVEALTLACALADAGEAIGCEWSSPRSRDAYVVTLWRSVNDGPREAVERCRPSGPTVYRDRVPAGATEVTYVVIATSESDRTVARSRAVTVRITRPVDTRPVDTPPVDTRPVDVVAVDARKERSGP